MSRHLEGLKELAEEVADISICLLAIAGLLGVDLEKACLRARDRRGKVLTGAPLTGGPPGRLRG